MSEAPCVRAFQAPKAGQRLDTCEDVFRIQAGAGGLGGDALALSMRVALADGATASSGSRLWAELLTQAAQEAVAPFSRTAYFLPKLARLRLQWRAETEAGLSSARSWWADAALDRGAFATLLRVQIRGNAWRAEALGDTCLFHLRGQKLLRSFPLDTPEAFQCNPDLLASAPGHDRDLAGRLRTCEGQLRRGDSLLLATDAVACWLLAQQGWRALPLLLGAGLPFQAWVEGERAAGRLKNDDATLVVIQIP